MKDKHESGNAPHGDSHLRGGQKTGKQKQKKGGATGGNMGAGQSGSEGLGKEKPTDEPGMGSRKPPERS